MPPTRITPSSSVASGGDSVEIIRLSAQRRERRGEGLRLELVEIQLDRAFLISARRLGHCEPSNINKVKPDPYQRCLL